MASVRLTLADVGDVYLDNRDAYGSNAVGNGNGGVGVCAWVHHHPVVLAVSFLQLVDQTSFVVGLVVVDLCFGEGGSQCCEIILERNSPVNLRLTPAEKVEIWAVDDDYFFHVAKVITFCFIFVPNI